MESSFMGKFNMKKEKSMRGLFSLAKNLVKESLDSLTGRDTKDSSRMTNSKEMENLAIKMVPLTLVILRPENRMDREFYKNEGTEC
jgi:hypothetical protein